MGSVDLLPCSQGTANCL